MRETPRLRRSLLFVPGAEPRKLERARGARADTLIFDLEDSVTPEHKVGAREQVVELLRGGGFADSELAVRVNAPGTPHFEADLEAVIAAGGRTIMLPKSESAEGLARSARLVEAIEAKLGSRGVRFLALVETAAGIARAYGLVGGTPRIDALCFGHADFSLDMGLAQADASQGVVFHARCTLAIAAKASQVAPIDTVYLAAKDEAAFREDVALGLRLGFEGKLCIHPTQVAIANELYTPTPGQIEKALRVVEEWRHAQAEGRGVFTLDETMVDAPLVAVQRRVLERARRAGVLPESRWEAANPSRGAPE